MKRLLAAWLILCLAIGGAFSQSFLPSGSGPPASYTGPGDIVPGAELWVGLRAYSAATIGTNAVRLRRSNDNLEQDFVTLADGSLDVASIATFKGANQVFIRTLYDQSGNGRNVVQTTNGNQMELLLGALSGTRPVMEVTGAALGAATTATVTIAQPMTVSAVANFDGVAGRYAYFGDGGSQVYFGHRGTTAHLYAGGELGPTVSNGWHRVQSVVNGASSDEYVDGSSTTGNPGAQSISSSTLIVGSDGAGAIWNNRLSEAGIWASAFSGANKAAMDANQQAWHGL